MKKFDNFQSEINLWKLESNKKFHCSNLMKILKPGTVLFQRTIFKSWNRFEKIWNLSMDEKIICSNIQKIWKLNFYEKIWNQDTEQSKVIKQKVVELKIKNKLNTSSSSWVHKFDQIKFGYKLIKSHDILIMYSFYISKTYCSLFIRMRPLK